MKKIIPIFMICLMLLVCANAVFAMEDANQTDLGLADESEELGAQTASYYFNASAENDDGNGSAENPYKYLTSSRIRSECDIYLADGEYDLDTSITIFNVNIYGQNPNSTIIKYDGVGFNVRNVLRISNVTLDGAGVYNNNIFTATNANFMNGHGTKDADKLKYENYFGGAVYSSNKNLNTKLTLINCTFTGNSADYGGAVYVNNGYLTVENCRFMNNLATNFGGAIAAEDATSITISKSRFYKNNSTEGSGGAIYVKKSEILNITDSVFGDAHARFGGAIVSLNTAAVICNSTFENNSARYYGGAVFHMYSNFTSENSTYKSNNALNGGGLYLDHVNITTLSCNEFAQNVASNLGAAIYGILNNYTETINNTLTDNDICYLDELNLDIGRGDYEIYQIDEVNITDLPPYYSMRDDDLLTPVKDQMDSGNCWAFAVMAVLESCLKKITGWDFDFSEENAKNLMAIYSDYGTTFNTNEGAYSSTAINYLTSWLGPIYDLDDVFDDKTALSPLFNSTLHVQNVAYLKRDSPTDNDAIKLAILKYGAVGTSMYYKSTYLKDKINYNSATSQTANHAAVIVGWDDNYSKSNFYGSPQGDGAWIVRSSWGEDWADHGYCYVSYYDVNFAKVGDTTKTYTIILNDTVKFDKNYQYDIAGPDTYIKANTSSIAYKNRFVSTDNEVLTGVSTYFNKEYNWTLSIYVNNVLKAFKSGNSPAGYWTIHVDEIPLYIGDVFEAVFNLTCDSVASVPISQAKAINTVTFKENISFINWNGQWKDLFKMNNKNFPSQVASIKAFTIVRTPDTATNLTVDYIGHDQIKVTVNVIDEYMNPARGNVSFNVNGMIMDMALDNGTASFIYHLDNPTIYILAQFREFEYVPSQAHTIYENIPENITLTLKIIKTDLNNVLLEITSTLDLNETLTISVNDIQANVEFVNKTATYYMSNLKNGDYAVDIHLNNTWTYNANNITETFTVAKYPVRITGNKNIVMYYGAGKTYKVRIYGEDGKPVTGGSVNITINKKKVTVKIDSKGYASYKISQKVGKYTITCEYKTAKVSNKVTVKTTLITKNKKVKKSKVIKFQAKLLNSKGKALKNKKITFKVKSKKYKVKTNKKGIAVLKLKNLKVGKHKVITTYKKLKNTNRITVKR